MTQHIFNHFDYKFLLRHYYDDVNIKEKLHPTYVISEWHNVFYCQLAILLNSLAPTAMQCTRGRGSVGIDV